METDVIGKNKNYDSDHQNSVVPMSERRSFISNTIVWMGFIFVLTSMMAGGGLAAGMTLKQVVIASLVGNIILSIFAVATSVACQRNGLGFALLSRYAFGDKGARITSVVAVVVNVCWYAIQSCIFGHFLSLCLGCTGTALEMVILVISNVVIGLFTYFGMKGVTILGYISIPAIVFLSIFASMGAVGESGGWAASITAYVPATSITFAEGVTLVVGVWVLTASSSVGDIMRFAKSPISAAMSALCGLLLGNMLMLITAGIACIAVGEYDLTAVLYGLGLVVPGLVLMTTNIFTTNASNLYSVSLHLSNILRVDRHKTIFIAVGLACVLSLFRPNEMGAFMGFLGICGMCIPPLPGIIIGDYYITHKANYESFDTASKKFMNWKASSFIVWVISTAAVYAIYYTTGWGLPALNGFVFGLVLQVIFNAAIKKKSTRDLAAAA